MHKNASSYQCGSTFCDLYLSAKVSIICADPGTKQKNGTDFQVSPQK